MKDDCDHSVSTTAVILCAGKGTRMNDDSKNKVCFDCAGVPVIRRILANMRLAGIDRFVLVVGHRAESVMHCLAEEPGVTYVYQRDQRGTGHAARLGLEALVKMGIPGRALVSMGDKVVSVEALGKILRAAETSLAVWGVQPVSANPGGGRVVTRDGLPYGVVEWADVAYQSLADVAPEADTGILTDMGLNEKKSRKVLARAQLLAPRGAVTLGGRVFSAEELRKAKLSNAGLYCFDPRTALEALARCSTENAQGELYLTDALEPLAAKRQAVLVEIDLPEEMLTFSTKPELRAMSRFFLKNASECLNELSSGKWDARLEEIYGGAVLQAQRPRYRALLEEFLRRYGDRRILLTRAPGRVNLMGRHIDHRGGGSNVMTIDRDVIAAIAPRDDDLVEISNLDAAYPPKSFRISEELRPAQGWHGEWLDFLALPEVAAKLQAERGHWGNYVKAALLRFQMAADFPLCGMSLVASGNIPVGAGLSSSSAIVVATAEAISALNCLNFSQQMFIDLCGEGEWFVGSRGGAGDHAAMKCGQRGTITQLDFLPFAVRGKTHFSEKYAVLLADSLQQSKKSEGSRDVFNERIASYEFALMLLQDLHPERGWRLFRELAALRPYAEGYGFLAELPLEATREILLERLPRQKNRLLRIFGTHADPGKYDLRGVALYGISEIERAERFGGLLEQGDYQALGEMMKISQQGDQVTRPSTALTDDELHRLAKRNEPFWRCCGAYRCSTQRIDDLCKLLDGLDGVLGSSIVGAGLGGSVIALVESDRAQNILETVNRKFYDAAGLPRSATVCRPGSGSVILGT